MTRFTKTRKICFQNLLITVLFWRNYDVIENDVFAGRWHLIEQVLKKLATADLVDWKHTLCQKFPTLVLLFATLSVAVACTTGTSLCSCSRYQRQRRLCSMR